MSVEESRVIVGRLYEEAWDRGDLEVVDELVAESFWDHHHGQGGPESLRGVIGSLRTTFPDMRFSVEDRVVEGSKVTTRFAISGTDEGGLLGLPATGRRVEFGGIFVDRVEGGKVAEHWGVSDMVGLLRQLGHMPALG